ncbi:hypothetical protein KKF91_09910 [Myxococcota bacterium]|nr:hypothetical protein [Myxococcota bacterium]MBU1430858.1 hypothetical protein [Myxococcota bacterium]MBU1899341.1 hypothetical protein [Myxococcota bacterium]
MNAHISQAQAALAAWAASPQHAPPVSGLFEGHIFCAPLQPDEDTKRRFVEAARVTGAGVLGISLGLDFKGVGVVDVLSTKQLASWEDARGPLAALIEQAQQLEPEFEVIRLKLELRAEAQGVPLDDAQMAALSAQTGGDHYFEFHVKLQAFEPTPERDAALKALCARQRERLGVEVAFSHQSMAHKARRFLNTRSYGRGLEAARGDVAAVIAAAEAEGYPTQMVIEELIIFDSNKALDAGWLEPPLP